MSSAKLKSGANRETRGPWGVWTQPLSTPELPAHKSAQGACSFGRPANSARPPSGADHRHTASMAKSSSNRAALSVLASRPSPSGEAPLYRSSPPRYGRGVRRSRGCPTTRRDLSDDDTTETEATTPNKSSFRCNSSADQPTDDQTDNAPSDGLNRLELHRRVPFLYRGDEPPGAYRSHAHLPTLHAQLPDPLQSGSHKTASLSQPPTIATNPTLHAASPCRSTRTHVPVRWTHRNTSPGEFVAPSRAGSNSSSGPSQLPQRRATRRRSRSGTRKIQACHPTRHTSTRASPPPGRPQADRSSQAPRKGQSSGRPVSAHAGAANL